MKKHFDQSEKDRMRNNPDNYKLGVFYYNTNDPRFILPKQNKWLGWTLNFGNPLSYIFLVGISLAVHFLASFI